MSPRLLSALLWGFGGALAFLVLVQGYTLAVDPLVSITQGLLVAVLVGVATAGSAYVLEHRIAVWSARRAAGETESHGGDGKSKS
ncbi:hypothetical protein GCU68_02275 [Natronorubrum aibiense]|uniref:DUF7981 domain-containing protein n=1 Tax=Natronorubrum aibiense TaxID=348826 RepID=A0A5P9P7Z8_9EURY|nr:hypothetical protein GCU68_02275 [Natronorubrum aibiense]